MSNDTSERLLLAERQFSELAEQLKKLKTAAQSIEQAGKATGQMRELAESAIKTAGDLGTRIHETAEILQKQNIPMHLREKEERQNTKFQDLMANLASLAKQSDALMDLLHQSRNAMNEGLEKLGQGQQKHAEDSTDFFSTTRKELSAIKRIAVAFAFIQFGALGAILWLLAKR